MPDEFERPLRKSVGDKAVRIDNSPRPVSPPRPDRGGLLELFRTWINSAPLDRRNMPRHQALAHQVWLGWRRGDDAFFANPARLVNLSRGGALVCTTNPPPESHQAWICLGDNEPSDCVEATVLEVRTSRRKECTVRLSFHEPCPHSFFEAALCLLAKPGHGRSSAAAGRTVRD